jgi:hypothetical protein
MVRSMSKVQLRVKLLFKMDQAQKDETFISRLRMYFETREGFLCLGFVLNVYKWHSSFPQNHIRVSNNMVNEKYTYKCKCRFIKPSSQISYVFL